MDRTILVQAATGLGVSFHRAVIDRLIDQIADAIDIKWED